MNFEPVKTLEELDSLDEQQIIEGYLSAQRDDPEPGPNRGRAFWFGWCNRQRDNGLLPLDDHHKALVATIIHRNAKRGAPDEAERERIHTVVKAAASVVFGGDG